MNSEIYQRVMDEYARQRDRNASEEARRREEIAEKHPDLAKLCHDRHRLILDGIENMLRGQGPAGEDLEKHMRDYNARIREALASAGYPENYLEPVYRCEKCRDTGYTGEKIREMCSCLKAALARAGDSAPWTESFETFDEEFYPETPLEELPKYTQRAYMHEIRKACESFADDYPGGGRINLLLHGKSGLGKTYLVRCVASRLMDRGIGVKYVTAFRMLDDLRQDYFRPEGVTQDYLNTDFLIIDDLGIEPMFDNITVEMILNVLNERMLRRKGTAVSTNLNRTELQKRYTERFISRMLSPATCLDLTFRGTDLRLYGSGKA